ncbi:hypothetical protein FC75_GL000404 [Lacticaseibacillus camelliae DSM 22697 = JCM 13995]|uniref:Cell wall elongation regulator TseB-like domain-containing protein n=2 Tax=Lacticaseibacillus camelliae TaxID=381742 RepID=A0A0R2FAT1_9LACO|nr:hypothetical protein FC75_GL000404 [Lacticaseibacillus camelliae DSM 22697 = JCM 13995]
MQWRNLIGPAIGLVILAIIIGAYVRALSPLHSVRRQAIAIARKTADVDQVSNFYWDKEDNAYLTVQGTTSKNQPVYVLIRQKTGKVRVTPQRSGISRSTAVAQAQAKFAPRKILNVGMRWRAKKFVWDVGYITKSGKLGYVTYDFKTGSQVNAINNL